MPAGYSYQNLNTETWARHFNESHVTIYATFQQGNNPIQVSGVDFKLYEDIVPPVEVSNLILLKPPTEVSSGKYVTTFLTNGLTEGDYLARITGSYAYGVSPYSPANWKTITLAGKYQDYILATTTTKTHDTPATTMHRYDIIQLKNDGTLSIKKGTEVIVTATPVVPDPDTDNIAIANIHVSSIIGKIDTTEITNVISVLLTVGGDMNLFYVPRIQWFIDTLKSQLGGFANQVPREYLLFDPTEVYWEDGRLLQYLQMAVDQLNMAAPPTPSFFTLDNVPVPSLVLLGAELFALASISCLEIASFFDINVPMRVNLYKGDKYKDLASFIGLQYSQNMLEWKKQYIYGMLEPIVITMDRLPLRVIRPVSLNLHYSSLMPF
jgi:hypothetical protein